MSGAGSSSCDGRSAIKSKYSPGSYSSSGGGLFGMLGGACSAWARSSMGGVSMNDTGSLGASTLGVMSSMGRCSAATFSITGPRSVRVYIPIPMYSCVLRINYTNFDIRILHTLMYQIDLCHTDRRINDFWCSPRVKYNITKLLYYYSNSPQQEPYFKFKKNRDDLIDQGRYLLIQICKICNGCDGSLLDNISATLEH